MIRTTDGNVGWVVGSLRECSRHRNRLTLEELHNLAASADFEGPLVDYKEKGNRIELAGKEKIGKRMAFKLVISMKNGENRIDFIDSQDVSGSEMAGHGQRTICSRATFATIAG